MAIRDSSKLRYQGHIKRVTKTAFICINIYMGACYILALTFNPMLITLVLKIHIAFLVACYLLSLGLKVACKYSSFCREYIDYVEDKRENRLARSGKKPEPEIAKRKVKELKTEDVGNIELHIEPRSIKDISNKAKANSNELKINESLEDDKSLESGDSSDSLKSNKSLEETIFYHKSSSAVNDPLMQKLLQINEKG